MARVSVTTTPTEIIASSQTRDVLEMINDTDQIIHVRHGGTIDLSSDTACGVPIAPGRSRAVSGPVARLAVSAAVDTGVAPQSLHYDQYYAE